MTSPVVPILFGSLFAWSIYRRVRRNIVRQKLHPRRAATSLIFFSIFCVLIIAGSFFQSVNILFAAGGGLVLGTVLGFIGLKLTKFETTDEGHFYKPNAPIGIVLSLLLVGRLIYHYWRYGSLVPAPGHPPPPHSPLTYFIIGLTFGYYIVYQAGLYLHSRDQNNPAKNV